MQLQELLEKIGLSPSESKIYLALLKNGELKVGDILKKTEINSGRIYDILTNLENKGFISKIIKDTIKYYKAAPPIILQEYMQEKEQELENQKNLIATEIKKFEKIYREHDSEVSVEIYTGKKGMRTAFEILFANAKPGDTHYVVGITTQTKYVS